MLQLCVQKVEVWGEYARYNKEEGGEDVIPKEREHDDDETGQHRQVELMRKALPPRSVSIVLFGTHLTTAPQVSVYWLAFSTAFRPTIHALELQLPEAAINQGLWISIPKCEIEDREFGS